ncbi:hypothetical protein ACT7CZ_05230 [Bacillus cereus]
MKLHEIATRSITTPGCSNTAFANKIGFSRCTFQNWLANKFDFSVGACEHMQFIMGCIHDELAAIK